MGINLEIDIICYFIKFLGINISLSICFYKITNFYNKLNARQKLITFISNILLSFLRCLTVDTIPLFFIYAASVFVYSLLFAKLIKLDIQDTIVYSIVSLAISYVASLISVVIGCIFYATFWNLKYINYISIILLSCSNVLLILLLFKIKRLKYGFTFFNNDFLKLLFLMITIILIFLYAIDGNHSDLYLLGVFFLIAIIFAIITRQAFIIYQKQKLQTQALKDYEKELQETKQKLQKAIDEKEHISKVQHEFKNRQEALKSKLAMLAKSNYNTETAEEFSTIIDRINNLSDEYYKELKTLPALVKTGIDTIDDMIKHMQQECYKNNIDFVFELKCNINKILENYMPENKLETLLGDLLENAIIAVNHSQNSYKSIMLVFGLEDEFYKIDVYDSGINFDINTLLNLGVHKCSTHLDEGGSGFGLITTYETLSNCNASLIITELDNSSYSKVIGIRFDNLNNYTINSYRADLILKANANKRNIIINNPR